MALGLWSRAINHVEHSLPTLSNTSCTPFECEDSVVCSCSKVVYLPNRSYILGGKSPKIAGG